MTVWVKPIFRQKIALKHFKYYEKSFLMNPDNFYAEDVIQKIKFPNIKPLTAQEKFSKVYSKKII
jgi:hypothetical protein